MSIEFFFFLENNADRVRWDIRGIIFSYLFFIISLFLMILIKFLLYKIFKVNIINYYKIIILFFNYKIINY